MKKQHPLDRITTKLSDSIVQAIDHFPEAQMPFASVELSKEEQRDNYLAVRDDPKYWYDLLMSKGLKAVVEYATTMEKMLKAHDVEDTEVEDGDNEINEGE